MKTLLFIILLSLISPLHAKLDEIEMGKLFHLSLEELLQVKITGSTLTNENLKSVPAAVTVFSREEISGLGLDSLNELMDLVPGFQAYRSSFGSQTKIISTRGLSVSGVSEILIMVDGQRLDTPRDNNSMDFGGRIPLINIERVEFIRGPGSALYGSNAMLAVVNIITRKDANELGMTIGNFNRRQVFSMTSKKLNKAQLDIFFQVEKDEGDKFSIIDDVNNQAIKTSDPFSTAHLNIKINLNQTRIHFQHQHTKADDFYTLGNVANDVNKRDDSFSAISIKQEFDWQSIKSWFWIGYHQAESKFTAQALKAGSLLSVSEPMSNDAFVMTVDFNNITEHRFQWHNDWFKSELDSLQFGLEYRHIEIPNLFSENNFDLASLANNDFPIPYYGQSLATTLVQKKSTRDIYGLYIQYQRQLTAHTHLNLGARYDKFSNLDKHISPRVSLVHAIDDVNNVKLLYGESFRAPSEGEQFLINNPVTLGNENLKSETVKTWELIWIAQGANMGSSLGYFENHVENSIQRVLFTANTGQFNNVDQDPVKGFEFEYRYELSDNWLTRTSYTHFTEVPATSFRESQQLASFTVNYRHAHWNTNFISQYFGSRQMATGGSDDNLIKLKNYWQLHGKVQYSFHNKSDSQVKGFIQINNLLNDKSEAAQINADKPEGIPGRGRELRIGIVWNF